MGPLLAQSTPSATKAQPPLPGANPFPSTYAPGRSGVVAITNATILTAAGPQIDNGTIVIRDNVIVAIGAGVPVPAGARVIDAKGKWVTPGLVDGHTHLASVSVPFANLADGLNEMSDPNTAELFAENSLWPQNPNVSRTRAAGVTTVQVLPGSANTFGGRTVVLKLVDATTIQAMKFPGAPYGVKMACGENPTRVYGPKGRAPTTRAEVIAGMRAGFAKGREYAQQWRSYQRKIAAGQNADAPKRDMQLDTLAGIAEGAIRVNVHCYRADDMTNVMDAAAEFGISVTAFHHATEAFKLIPQLRARPRPPCILTWGGPDWGGFKMEAYDHSAMAVPMLDRAGLCVAVTSDSTETGQHLNIDAARSMAAGQRAGLKVDRSDAIRWITINPARSLGVSERTGSLEVGKMADVVVWSGDPFSVYSHPETVLIDGVTSFVFGDPAYARSSDLELDQTGRRYER